MQGIFYRTIRMMDNGIKPVYVFDGKPPEMKGGTLEKRAEIREKAMTDLKEAQESREEGDTNRDAEEKYEKRLVHVSKEQNEEAQKLLMLMGVPVILAPSEAEAQCAALAASGQVALIILNTRKTLNYSSNFNNHHKVFGTATEDMDALTFGSSRLLRHMTASQARKLPVTEIELKTALEEMGLTMDEFIDVCILCGCDYTGSIRGIGPSKSFDLIKKYHTIENAIAHLDTKKHPVPEDFR